MITQERLKEVLHYDPLTGLWTWAQQRGRSPKGTLAGWLSDTTGYLFIRIDRRLVGAHRLAWLYMTGEWPHEVDHKNGSRTDNKWSNLREVTRQQNQQNKCVQSNNKSGLKGASFHKQTGRWRAAIFVAGKQMHLGLFSTPEEAHIAYNIAAKKHFGVYARIS